MYLICYGLFDSNPPTLPDETLISQFKLKISFRCCNNFVSEERSLIITVLQGIATGPKHFPCLLTPRSEHHAHLIRTAYADCRPVFEMFEHELSQEVATYVAQW